MKSSKQMRISAMVIIGLYASYLVYGAYHSEVGVLHLVFIPLIVLIAAGIMFLGWKRPREGGLAVLAAALLYFLMGARNWTVIYSGIGGGVLLLLLFLVSPLLLAGVLFLSAHRAMKSTPVNRPFE